MSHVTADFDRFYFCHFAAIAFSTSKHRKINKNWKRIFRQTSWRCSALRQRRKFIFIDLFGDLFAFALGQNDTSTQRTHTHTHEYAEKWKFMCPIGWLCSMHTAQSRAIPTRCTIQTLVRHISFHLLWLLLLLLLLPHSLSLCFHLSSACIIFGKWNWNTVCPTENILIDRLGTAVSCVFLSVLFINNKYSWNRIMNVRCGDVRTQKIERSTMTSERNFRICRESVYLNT